MRFSVLFVFFSLFACGGETSYEDNRTHQSPYDNLRNQLIQLQSELAAIVASDYASCSGSLSAAAQNICKIAQAATVESQVEMRGELNQLATELESRILAGSYDDEEIRDRVDTLETNFNTLSGAWERIYGDVFPNTSPAGPTPTESDCRTAAANASVMECLVVQGDAIATLQSAVSVLSGAVNGTMSIVEVGSENVLAGPVYEQMVRLGDKSKINAYTDGLSAPLTVGNNPIDPTNGSPNVVITSTAHGLTAGDKVDLEDCSSGAGFTWQHLRNKFEVLAAPAPTANTFAINLGKNATNSSNFGGSLCIVRKFTGAGMSTVWVSADPSDAAVRKTTGGTKSYNFIIKKGLTGGGATEGYVCYDQTNRSATYATINAATSVGLTGNIRCK